jgi:hypothetical protein
VWLDERGDGKIQGWHGGRLKVMYFQQSSQQQALDHEESTLPPGFRSCGAR